jgi:hypothetical protein
MRLAHVLIADENCKNKLENVSTATVYNINFVMTSRFSIPE